jgi:hypothetical protein
VQSTPLGVSDIEVTVHCICVTATPSTHRSRFHALLLHALVADISSVVATMSVMCPASAVWPCYRLPAPASNLSTCTRDCARLTVDHTKSFVFEHCSRKATRSTCKLPNECPRHGTCVDCRRHAESARFSSSCCDPHGRRLADPTSHSIAILFGVISVSPLVVRLDN